MMLGPTRAAARPVALAEGLLGGVPVTYCAGKITATAAEVTAMNSQGMCAPARGRWVGMRSRRSQVAPAADDGRGFVQALLPLGVRLGVGGDSPADAEHGPPVRVELDGADRHVELTSRDR